MTIDYGAKLRAIRALLGLTQEQVAERAALDRRDIIKFEQGIALPAPQTREALKKALGVDLDAPHIEQAFSILAGERELALAA